MKPRRSPAELPVESPPPSWCQRRGRRGRRGVRVLVALSVASWGVVPAVATADPLDAPEIAPLIQPVGDDEAATILPELGGVPVDGPAYRSAQAAYDDVSARLQAAIERHDAAVEQIAAGRERRAELDEDIARDTEVKARADAQIERVSARLRHLALQAYVGTSDAESVTAALDLDLDRVLEGQRRVDLSSAVVDGSVEDLLAHEGVSRAAAERLSAYRTERAAVVADIEVNLEIRTASTADTERFTAERAQRRVALDQARAVAMVEGTNLPLVALDAYVRGARAANDRRPGCDLHWSLLAGIGQIESHQGTFGGARLTATGQVTRPIYGVALDGTNGNERIEVDGGFMRAEGPMQFLPSTWRAVAVDGNGDGVRDPQNLYDAAASAGAYLCRRGVSVATDSGRTAAVLTYNFSMRYVADVVAQQRRYAEALPTFPEPPEPEGPGPDDTGSVVGGS